MKRATSQVAREIADVIEGTPFIDGSLSDAHPIRKATLQRWLLLLAPPRTRTVRRLDVARTARRATVNDLDALCRYVVFRRDGGICRKCGKTAVDWSHVYSRRFKWLRWDLDNSFASCKGDHLWWHARPADATAWWRLEIGEERFMALVLRAARPRNTDPGLIRAYLEQEKAKL